MQRERFIDIAKGIAMLLVVMQHCGGTLDDGMRLLCKFDVPLFFICSGYLHYRKEMHVLKSLKKASERILLPFFTACLFAALFYQESFIDILISSGKRGYWFLEALFLMICFFWCICRKRFTIIIGAFTFELLFLTLTKYAPDLVNDMSVAPYLSRYFPCFIAGILIKAFRVDTLNRSISGILGVMSLVCFLTPVASTNVSYLLHVTGYLSGSVFAFFLIKEFDKKMHASIAKAIGYIGMYSLNIYIIHFYIVPYFSQISPWFVVNFMVTFTIAVIVSIMSLIIGKTITKTTPLNKILTP